MVRIKKGHKKGSVFQITPKNKPGHFQIAYKTRTGEGWKQILENLYGVTSMKADERRFSLLVLQVFLTQS
jgi:hypothetical protein